MQTDLTRVKWTPALFELETEEKPEQCKIYDHFQGWKLNLMELLKLWCTLYTYLLDQCVGHVKLWLFIVFCYYSPIL